MGRRAFRASERSRTAPVHAKLGEARLKPGRGPTREAIARALHVPAIDFMADQSSGAADLGHHLVAKAVAAPSRPRLEEQSWSTVGLASVGRGVERAQ
jgi:hypothetical protein